MSGPIPIPPRYAFGIFYSRYWAYNDIGEKVSLLMTAVFISVEVLCFLQELVRGYEDRKIPLDVLVTDMDWHVTFYKEAAAGKKDQVACCTARRPC